MATFDKPYDLATADHDYPDWSGPPQRSILICTQPRSGSTLLGEALYFAGDLGCPLEYLHRGFRPRLETEWGVSDPGDYVAAMWRHRTAPSGTLAIKLMWPDVQDLALERDPAGFAALADLPPERVAPETYARLARLLSDILPHPICIYLYRRDRLRQAVSSLVATQTGQWRAVRGAEMRRQREPDYDGTAIARLLGHVDACNGHWRNLIAAMGGARFSLAYEDLVRDYAGSVGRLLAALGSHAAPPPIRMQRQADHASEALVARYLEEQGVPAAS